MFLVTGGAGFIGSNIVRALNSMGAQVLVVDNMKDSRKFLNIVDCEIADYMDKDQFRAALENGTFDIPLEGIFHQGACSNTLESDGRYMIDNNYSFSKYLLHHAIRHKVPFVYASSAAVYGNGVRFSEETSNERPINVYGYSKLIFDQYVRRVMPAVGSGIVGLRYFNVYGPREIHKDKMASIAYQMYCQLKETGLARLYRGSGVFGNGEQRRDFIFVDDVVKINMFFMNNPEKKGIYNVGTGASRSFNDIAKTWISLLGRGEIAYIPFPEELLTKYQNFTQADISALRLSGYSEPFVALETGVAEYYAHQKREGG